MLQIAVSSSFYIGGAELFPIVLRQTEGTESSTEKDELSEQTSVAICRTFDRFRGGRL